MPELFLKLLINWLLDKELERAKELHAINAIIGKLTSARGNMYAVIKGVLEINERLTIGSTSDTAVKVIGRLWKKQLGWLDKTKEQFL